MFRMCFPDNYIWEVVVPMTNRYIDGPNMTLQDFYVWMGCHFFMEGFEGIEKNKMWWLEKTIDMFEGAPFSLSEYMSGRRFQNIGTSIRYTKIESPAFLDRFHDVRQMIEYFNDHYEGEYVPSWLNCLDESMNSFLDKFFPGFMCVPRKPHPFGNKYHSIDDGAPEKGLEGKPIMWRVKIKEGKIIPRSRMGVGHSPPSFLATQKQPRSCLR